MKIRSSHTTRVLLGLAAGLLLGAGLAAVDRRAAEMTASIVEPIGTVWLNALQMTVIPLIVSLLITGIAGASGAASAGRVGGRTLLVIACLLAGAGTYGALLTPLFLAWFPIARSTAEAMQQAMGTSGGVMPEVPGFGEWLTGLVPSNAIGAAAEGAILPLVIFSLIFGLAAARIVPDRRERLIGFFAALGDAMMVMVHWVLLVAPAGVFALVFPVAAGSGLAALGVLSHYVALLSSLCILATIALYPVTVLVSGASLRQFAGAAAPAQAIAFSTRSSLASLPAMLEGVQERLGMPPATSGLILPLAVTLMRVTSPIVNLASGLFAAALYGMELTPLQIATGAAVAVVASLGTVGLPGQVNFFAMKVPIFMAMGVPLEVLGLMLAVEVIPDTFMTVGNVTAHVGTAAIVARGERVPVAAEGEAPARS